MGVVVWTTSGTKHPRSFLKFVVTELDSSVLFISLYWSDILCSTCDRTLGPQKKTPIFLAWKFKEKASDNNN